VSCQTERVTALVDGVLAGAERADLEAHLAECAACRALVEEEEQVRAALRSLPAPQLPARLEARVRRRLRQARRPRLTRLARLALPLAAVLVAGVWARELAPVVAWELSRDHDHCFSKARLPAEVWSAEPSVIARWFAERGSRLPLLPSAVRELVLVGGRRCPLPDVSFASHIYYASRERQLSVFVLSHGVHLDGGYATRSRGNAVALMRIGGRVVGVVGGDEDDVAAAVARLRVTVAAFDPARSPLDAIPSGAPPTH
jgi:anti-sigma factor RsiW